MSEQPESPDARAVFDVTGIDVRATVRFTTLLPGDPCTRLGSNVVERATLTPDGPATMRVRWEADRATVEVWGAGATWLAERAPGYCGVIDDPTGFEPTHRQLRTVWERNVGLRVQRTDTLWHDLVWFVLQQRVRFIDAANAWRDLVRAHGAPAPGPLELMTPPTATTIAGLAYHDLHAFGIERSRAETLIAAARAAPRVLAAGVDPEEARTRLQAIRGIGPWTLAGLDAMTWGSPDAVIVGDVGLPQLVCWVLAREEWGDDDRMLELLEPYRPHRYRVIQLCYASGARVPRRRPTRYGVNDMRRR